MRILAASPQIHVVHLNSFGGRIGEAEKLYNTIRENNLITYVSANCMSACTVAFAGGTERWLYQNAQLGFHAPTFPGMSELELKEAAQSQRIIFNAAGFAAMIPFFKTHLYTGPVALTLGGADISMLIGLPVSAAVYLLACRSLDLKAEMKQIVVLDRNLETEPVR